MCVLGPLQARANAEIQRKRRRLSHPVRNMGCKHTQIHTGMSSLARNTEYKADKQRQKQVNLKISSQMQADSSSRTDSHSHFSDFSSQQQNSHKTPIKLDAS